MSSFRQALVGARFNGPGTWADGDYTESASSPISFKASVQPANGKDMESLPEGRRDAESYRLYTSFVLKTADDKTKINADRVTLVGRQFEVMRVFPWLNNVISHHKVLVSLINEN